MKTTGGTEKVRRDETAQERRGQVPKDKERETAMTEKRKGSENRECQAVSPHFDDFAFTMLINQQMRLGKGAHRGLAPPHLAYIFLIPQTG